MNLPKITSLAVVVGAERNTNKADYKVQVSGYRVIQVLSILGQVPSCCVRKEEDKGNRTNGRKVSLI